MRKNGFTVLDLLISLFIIGVLSALIGPNYAIITEKNQINTLEETLHSADEYVKSLRDPKTGKYPSTGGSPPNWMTPEPASAQFVSCSFSPQIKEMCEKLPKLGDVPNACPEGTPAYKPAIYYASDGVHYKIQLHCAGKNSNLAKSNFHDPLRTNWSLSISSDAVTAATW